MAKLYFRYGAVSSAKTMNLLAVAHNYRKQNKQVLLVKPALDDRFGRENITSRAGLSNVADMVVEDDTVFELAAMSAYHCVLVDEAQFLPPKVIDQFRQIATAVDVPVICYGLRVDFRTELFPGSKRLMELADAIEEVKTTCHFCTRKAVFNLKLLDNKPTLAGPKVQMGAEETYLPACAICYQRKLANTQRHPATRGAPTLTEDEANVGKDTL